MNIRRLEQIGDQTINTEIAIEGDPEYSKVVEDLRKRQESSSRAQNDFLRSRLDRLVGEIHSSLTSAHDEHLLPREITSFLVMRRMHDFFVGQRLEAVDTWNCRHLRNAVKSGTNDEVLRGVSFRFCDQKQRVSFCKFEESEFVFLIAPFSPFLCTNTTCPSFPPVPFSTLTTLLSRLILSHNSNSLEYLSK